MTDDTKSTAKAQRLPRPLIVAAVVVFEVAAWLLFSGTEYDSSAKGLGVTTAGWFVIGQFILLPLSPTYGGLFVLLSRFVSRKAVGISLVVISLVLVGAALKTALPQQRFKAIVGKEVAANAVLYRLNVHDSSNDGITSFGEFFAPSNTVEVLVQFRRLKKWNYVNRDLLAPYFPKAPPVGIEYGDKHGHFTYDAETGIM